ncbi:hypothetical protein PBRA_007620 [Plasmodiophora brassicae]|nr:hypothetical protein PBRA_007620 [Plasmodiophora brassicae]
MVAQSATATSSQSAHRDVQWHSPKFTPDCIGIRARAIHYKGVVMEDAVQGGVAELGLDKKAERFLYDIGLMDAIESGLYRLYAEGMPRDNAYLVVADELAAFGRRWKSQNLLPPTTTDTFKQYCALQPPPAHTQRQPSRFDRDLPGGPVVPTHVIQERFRRRAARREHSGPDPVAARHSSPPRLPHEVGNSETAVVVQPAQSPRAKSTATPQDTVTPAAPAPHPDTNVDNGACRPLTEEEAVLKIQAVSRGKAARRLSRQMRAEATVAAGKRRRSVQFADRKQRVQQQIEGSEQEQAKRQVEQEPKSPRLQSPKSPRSALKSRHPVQEQAREVEQDVEQEHALQREENQKLDLEPKDEPRPEDQQDLQQETHSMQEAHVDTGDQQDGPGPDSDDHERSLDPMTAGPDEHVPVVLDPHELQTLEQHEEQVQQLLGQQEQPERQLGGHGEPQYEPSDPLQQDNSGH